MSEQIVPTKGNLLSVKKTLALSRSGFELLDRKRNILIREMMSLIDRANKLQGKIDTAYEEAYSALQRANITLGMVKELSQTVPVENGLNIAYRSVMGVEIPMVSLQSEEAQLPFGLVSTNILLDRTYLKFDEVKKLTAELAEVENSVYRLAYAVKKTQKRANALKNIMIPRFEQTVKVITEALEEKDREDFSRMKIIKRQKNNRTA
ncbi:MAG: V-type ATP synthase subunit D [Oscillospiraceae bacterium]|nr:V-type ATP synthase subunit D [Oscillospiraceae bacterium]